MSLLRVSTSTLARVTKAPTFAMAARGYADGPTEKAGATASSQGWSKREQVSPPPSHHRLTKRACTDAFPIRQLCARQAQENQYVQQAEKEKLEKLRASIRKQREHLDEVRSRSAPRTAVSIVP